MTIDKDLIHIVDELLQWTSKHVKTKENAIFFGVSEGDSLLPDLERLFKARNLSLIEDCSIFETLTLKEVKEKYKNIVVTYNCWEQNFDSSVTCSGFLPYK